MPPPDDVPMIPMRLSRIVIRDNSEQQWIFLTEKDGVRGFPIVIGPNEAGEIQRVVTGTAPPRPLTHQLAFRAIEALGGRVAGIDIVELRDNTFYARLLLQADDGEQTIEVDARPSDAVALGLRAGCPIRVSETVLEHARSDSAVDPLKGPEEPETEPGIDPEVDPEVDPDQE